MESENDRTGTEWRPPASSGKMDYHGFFLPRFWDGFDERILEDDEILGFRFAGGCLISSRGFITLEEVMKGIRSGYPTILHMGDSSTSGYDSNETFKPIPGQNDPFFTYKTYPDLCEESPFFANSVNAGVPGYTSYHGRKYAETLLRRFAMTSITIGYVTIFFGNNDGVYNQLEDKVRLDRKRSSASSRGERVTVEDYSANLKHMIVTCREYGAKPMLIIPPVHYDTEPGIRGDKHRDRSLELLKRLGKTSLAAEMEKARDLFESGKLEEACEQDRVLPRLKNAYREALFRVSKETRTPLVDVQSSIPLRDNADFFADYCHPLEKVNRMIVKKTMRLIERDRFREPFSAKLRRAFKRTGAHDVSEDGPRSDIYPLR